MTIAREEIFGPVHAAIELADVDEAIARANQSTYGLAAAVWTRDIKKAHDVARKLQRARSKRIHNGGTEKRRNLKIDDRRFDDRRFIERLTIASRRLQILEKISVSSLLRVKPFPPSPPFALDVRV